MKTAWLKPPHSPYTETNTQQCLNSSTSQLVLCTGTQTVSSPCHSLTPGCPGCQSSWLSSGPSSSLCVYIHPKQPRPAQLTNTSSTQLQNSQALVAVVAQLETWPTTAFTFPSLLVGQSVYRCCGHSRLTRLYLRAGLRGLRFTAASLRALSRAADK